MDQLMAEAAAEGNAEDLFLQYQDEGEILGSYEGRRAADSAAAERMKNKKMKKSRKVASLSID